MAVADGALWIGTYADDTLWKVERALGRLTDLLRLGHKPWRIAAGADAVWVFATDGTVLRVDPATAEVTDSLPLGVYPPFKGRSIAVGHGAVWVATTSA